MQLIISVLILFILINCVLKLSFWRIWQAALFGAVCGAFVIATYPYAILQSKTQLADYLQNTTALQNMAVIITLESVVCFAYCIAVLRGWFGQQERWWVKPLKWYPSLLVFPVLFYLQTELVFSFPGTSFSAISYAFAAAVVVLFPLLCHLFRLLLPEKEMRLETHFLVSLFVCIIGLLTTVNGNVTYPAVDEPTNWRALGFAFGLFLVLFVLGALWNRIKWIVLQKRNARIYNQYMAKRKNDKRLNDLIKNLTPDKVDDLRKALPAKDNSLYIRYLRDLLTNPASQDYADYLISNFENDAEKDVILSKLLTKIGPVLGLIGTLIAMSPALVGLSTGDIAGMSYNMQVVFATTVVGLVISGVGLVSLQFKQRWYAKDVNNLDYVSRKLIEKNTEA